MTALLLSRSSFQRWLLTRDLPRNSVMELTVELDTAAMIQTTLFAVLTLITTQIGVELLLMTALLLSRSSFQRWLLTRDLPRNSVMELTVELDTAAMIQTTLFAVLTLITTQIGVELLLMTALLLSGSSFQRWLLTRMTRNTVEVDTAIIHTTVAPMDGVTIAVRELFEQKHFLILHVVCNFVIYFNLILFQQDYPIN